MARPAAGGEWQARGHFVYIMTCSDSTYYTGYTTEPGRRLRQHNDGTASRFTRSRLPVRLSYLEVLPTRGAALRRENEIKAMDRRRKATLIRKYEETRAT